MAIADIYDAVMAYDEDGVAEPVRAELDVGTDVRAGLDHGLVAALDTVGQKFNAGTLFVPEMRTRYAGPGVIVRLS
jgi:methanogenic corrinoid protein MtbC1